MKLSELMEQSDIYPKEQPYPDGNPLHQEYMHFITEVRKLEAVADAVGDGGDIQHAADLLQEATNKHGVNQTFNNNPYDVSDRLTAIADALAHLENLTTPTK